MDIKQLIESLEKEIPDAQIGLPQDVFCFVSRMAPMINVDLLIKDENNRTLLAWRDDEYSGKGWHIPGGIIRYKEKIETRIQKVAETEIGRMVEFDPEPIAINQMICKQNTRGHFISLLYKCFLSGDLKPQSNDCNSYVVGHLKWHNECPKNLIEIQNIYKKFF